MERLANKIADKIALELAYPDERRQVLAYGLIAMLQTVLMTAIVLIAGALLNIFIESAILCFAVAILRKYSGGAHARSIASCTIVGVMFCIGFGFAMKSLGRVEITPVVLIIISVLTFSYALYIAIRKAPVDSLNKPIRTEKKRKNMKRATIVLISLYMVVSAILIFYLNRSAVFVSALFCLLLSVIWQMSSLTNPGKRFLENMDRLIYGIITWKGGHSNEKD